LQSYSSPILWRTRLLCVMAWRQAGREGNDIASAVIRARSNWADTLGWFMRPTKPQFDDECSIPHSTHSSEQIDAEVLWTRSQFSSGGRQPPLTNWTKPAAYRSLQCLGCGEAHAFSELEKAIDCYTVDSQSFSAVWQHCWMKSIKFGTRYCTARSKKLSITTRHRAAYSTRRHSQQTMWLSVFYQQHMNVLLDLTATL